MAQVEDRLHGNANVRRSAGSAEAQADDRRATRDEHKQMDLIHDLV
jgi:hypothetical protein